MWGKEIQLEISSKYLNTQLWTSVERSGLDTYIWEASIQTIFEVTSLDEITKGKNREGKKSMPWNVPMLRGWGDERKQQRRQRKSSTMRQKENQGTVETEKWVKKCFKEKGAINCQVLSLNLTWKRNEKLLKDKREIANTGKSNLFMNRMARVWSSQILSWEAIQ